MKRTTLLLFIAAFLLADTTYAQRRFPTSKERSNSSKRAPVKRKTTKKRRGEPEMGKVFNLSAGLSLALSNKVVTKLSDGNGSATITRNVAAPGLFIYPKFHVFSNDNFSISIGIPLTLAFTGSANTNSRTGTESSSSFVYDLPIMVDFNGGVMARAKRYSEERFGYFVGVGFGIENGDANYTYESSGYQGNSPDYTKAKSVGPNFHAGAVLKVGNSEKPKFIGLRLSYKLGLNDDKFNYFTPSVFINF